MAKIFAPNEDFTGTVASVAFAKGVGQTNNKRLLEWFVARGYKVEGKATEAKK